MTWILFGVAATVAALAVAYRLLALWGGADGRPIVAGLAAAIVSVLQRPAGRPPAAATSSQVPPRVAG